MIEGLSHILIVDDDPQYRYGAALSLRRAGYEVSESVNGRDALTRLRKDNAIDLILIDLDMPEMSGVQLLHVMRRSAVSARVIVVTGRSESELVDGVIGDTCLAVIGKPADGEKFVTSIENIFAEKPRQAEMRARIHAD